MPISKAVQMKNIYQCQMCASVIRGTDLWMCEICIAEFEEYERMGEELYRESARAFQESENNAAARYEAYYDDDDDGIPALGVSWVEIINDDPNDIPF